MESSPFQTFNGTSSWLLYILTDSALPTGGFVASSGLESAQQAGLVTKATLPSFITESAQSFATQTIAFVKKGYNALDADDPLQHLLDCDDTCEAVMVTNNVARRASLAQGVAMLTLYLKCFADTLPQHADIVKQYKNLVMSEESTGHFPVCFGFICRCLDVDRDGMLHLWLYLFTRTLLSSAVRLNLVGPYEAQRLLLEARTSIEAIALKARDMPTDESYQTHPLLDVCQGMHDRLYSRLFNS